MQKINFGGVSFYTLTKPIEVKLAGAATPAGAFAPFPTQPEANRPIVVITGRGQSAGRVSTLVRLRPDVVKEIKSLVDGPLYLTIELALRHYAMNLRARAPGSVEMIKASDLS